MRISYPLVHDNDRDKCQYKHIDVKERINVNNKQVILRWIYSNEIDCEYRSTK